MKIQNKQDRKNLVDVVWRGIRNNASVKIILFLIFSSVFALFFIYVGVSVNKSMNETGQKDFFKALSRRVSELDFSFIPKYAKSQFVETEDFKIDIKFENWERIRYLREKGVNSSSLRVTQEMEELVPAKITYNQQTYKVEIGLTGGRYAHIKHPYKWSLYVNVKGDKTIKGMKKFALLYPEARGYLTDWVAMEMLKANGVIGLRNDFISVSVNGKDHGLYYLEERFDKRLIENNKLREGIIFKLYRQKGIHLDKYDQELKIYGQKKVLESEELSEQLAKLKQLTHAFLNEDIGPERLFDLKKFASLFVVSDIMDFGHPINRRNLRLYFNPITNLIEPIGREWGYLRESTKTVTEISIGKPDKEYNEFLQSDYVLSKIINSNEFQEEYLKQADILSERAYLDSILNNKATELDILLKRIYKEYPFYIFPLEIMNENQDRIKNELYPKTKLMDVFYDKRVEDSIFLKIDSKIDLPIEVYYFTYKQGEKIVPTQRMIIKSSFKSTAKEEIAIQLPASIDFDAFSIEKLEIHYGVLGVDNVKSTTVYPREMQNEGYTELNYSKQSSNAHQFDFLTINEGEKKITFSSDVCTIDQDLIIPKGYQVFSKAGIQINLIDSSRIISYSPIFFSGKKDGLISITSSDSTGQGLVVFNADNTSEMSFVEFTNLSNIFSFGWNLRGAVTFYESPINISNCIFNGNLRGDDYLNIIRTEFNIADSKFVNTNADAFDADYCKGTLKTTDFINIGNDAIDVSGTNIHLIDVSIIQPEDKGLSGGEESHMIAENITIEGGEIAVASKDNSVIDIDKIDIKNSKLAFCAFQKKSEFGPGVIIAKNSTIENIERDHLIETASSLIIDGEAVVEKSDSVKEMLYGKEYGKSSK